MYKTVFGISLLLSFVTISYSASLNDTETLHTDLFQSYNKNVRPATDQSGAINVDVTLYLKAIQEFDEVNEKLSVAASAQLAWLDSKINWDPSQYGGLTLITVARSDVWVPDMSLSSAASSITTVGKATDIIRYEHTGSAVWMTASLIQSTCSVSVRNYPFDIQSCDISFSSLGYKNYEVNITAGLKTIAFDVYSPNALWDVVGSEVKTVLLGGGSETEIIFTLKLERKAAFAVINIILPILVLSLLNVLVFVLVPESGERIGYCITTLLAIAVYMTIVNDLLPQTSEPVPLISYKLMIDLFISALIVMVTILNMRVYSKPDESAVNDWLQSLYRRLTCATRKVYPKEDKEMGKQNGSTQLPRKENGHHQKDQSDGFEKSVDYLKSDSDDVITWKKISYMIDIIALVTFTSSSLINTIVYIAMAMAQS